MTGEPVSSKRRIVSRTAASKRASIRSAGSLPAAKAFIPSTRSGGRGILPMGSVGSVMERNLFESAAGVNEARPVNSDGVGLGDSRDAFDADGLDEDVRGGRPALHGERHLRRAFRW